MSGEKAIIIGGGPAGLTAAYELAKNNVPCLLLEQGDKLGGIAKTENYHGYYFDLGGHRFFSKSEEINKIWHEVLRDNFLTRSRLSRIYYRRKFFNYPLKPFNALFGLGLLESFLILISYVYQRLFPYPQEKSFEEWVSNRFGRRLYEIFFKSYTEKVWGISCSDIGADWAAQRIKGLSLTSAVKNAIFGDKGKKIKTLISEFEYPKYGPGMMWEEMAKIIRSRGGEIKFNSRITSLKMEGNRVKSCVINESEEIAADQFINSMPLRDLILQILPHPPTEIVEYAEALKYRAFLIVALVIDQESMFPDNWIYIHSPEVKLGRIQNFKNWSPFMVADQIKTCLGLEYFCDFGDDLWNSGDKYLMELGAEELVAVGLLDDKTKVLDSTVLRVKNAYPVYDSVSANSVKKIREYLSAVSNLQTIGRAGMHRYNNMDHSMLTGLYAARNLIEGKDSYNLWDVNAEKEYLESTRPLPRASSGH